MSESTLSPERLRELFAYNPETGVLSRRVSKRMDLVGKPAGYASGRGHMQVVIDSKAYYVHRVVWAYVHGAWPEAQIDHINGNRSDNRIANLRDVSGFINQQNRKRAQSNSTSGLLGASKNSRRPRSPWAASIKVNNRTVWLGTFKTAEAAHAAYMTAKREHHPAAGFDTPSVRRKD